jgi:hypothetical protein
MDPIEQQAIGGSQLSEEALADAFSSTLARIGAEAAATRTRTTIDSLGLPVLPIDDTTLPLLSSVLVQQDHTVVMAWNLPPRTTVATTPSLNKPKRLPDAGFHTIKQTLDRFMRNDDSNSRDTRPSERPGLDDDSDAENEGCSGSDGGYDGSASSNEQGLVANMTSSSSCSDVSLSARRRASFCRRKQGSSSQSSEDAEFSSSDSSSAWGNSEYSVRAFRGSLAPSESESFGSSEDPRSPLLKLKSVRNSLDSKPAPVPWKASSKASNATPIIRVGCDVMAHILTFLEPPDILTVLTAPLSRDWLATFTRQPELWRVLCVLEPFKAPVDDDDDTDDSLSHYPDVEKELRRTFGKFRIMYTSFVRCMRYLARIKDDAANGRPPSGLAKESTGHNISANRNQQVFLARARGVVMPAGISVYEGSTGASNRRLAGPIGLADDGSAKGASPKKRKLDQVDDGADGVSERKPKAVKLAFSKITQRLLGPAITGEPGEVELPWACAIYSIVNWMMAFSYVEGIQTMCLKILPVILENEQQRVTGQQAGLTDMVLRNMVTFADSAQLHTAAFHTIVLLARPLGGQEGMLFHSSMVNASGILEAPDKSQSGRNGIAVMLDSMKRFSDNEVLQAMSCWSLVNIALSPLQKEELVKLGGIEATTNAMKRHPHSAEVQVRQACLECRCFYSLGTCSHICSFFFSSGDSLRSSIW